MKLPTIITALDLSPIDKKLIKTAQFAVEQFHGEKTYFAHVLPDFQFEPSVTKELNKVFADKPSLREHILTRIRKEIEDHYPLKSTAPPTVLANSGTPYAQLLEWLENYPTDLLIVGNKINSEGSGITARRLARKVKSAIWFVTEKHNVKPLNILVPIDFSEGSLRALQAALQLKKNDPQVEVTPCHVFDIPLNYYNYGGYSYTALDIPTTYYYEQYSKFVKRYYVEEEALEPLLLLENKEFSFTRTILKNAVKEKFDLIVIGAKGHTPINSFLFGSHTENLLTNKDKISTLVVR